MAAAATSGPSGCAHSDVVGLPRRPVDGAGRSQTSRAATRRATVSAAKPLGIPTSAATWARVTPGWPCTARMIAACADVRSPAFISPPILYSFNDDKLAGVKGVRGAGGKQARP